ncbi:MAG: peptidase M6, partial [Prevotella sp.]|nr:peptidase M6 [Prevotella sp.]
MKKILLTLSMAITMSSAWAAKAINKPITIQQSDGTLITVYLHGDEDFHWYTSVDGTILLRNGNDFTPITESPETFFAKAENARRMNVMKREPVTGSSNALFPHTGSPKALVILAQYQDVAFSLADPKKSFDQYLNKSEGEQEDFGASENLNYGSVRQYFMDMSNGQYSPTFDVVGPVTLPNNMEYYGGTNDNATDEKA